MTETKPTLAVPRILVIDDRPKIRKFVRDILEQQITPDVLGQYGISHFEVNEAESAEDGEQRLKEATACPYDLVLLDLHLPKTAGDEECDVEHGNRLLRYIKESQTAKAVAIVSAFYEYEDVIKTIRCGALDFVKKPIRRAELEPTVLNALARVMTGDSNRILNQRIRDLVAYAEIGLTYSFKLIFSTLLQGIADAVDGIEKSLRDQHGLNKEKDPYDSMVLKLRAHEKAVAQARQDWAGLQTELGRGGKILDVSNVGKILRDLKESLLHCLAIKRVAFKPPDLDQAAVLTFENDVEVVLREIIVGTLSELPDYPDYGEEREIKVSFGSDDNRSRVSFQDNLDPIPEEAMNAINKGQRIIPDKDFGRVWGLSVAQHVALRGGGELNVRTERGRNVVTYFIPLADHA